MAEVEVGLVALLEVEEVVVVVWGGRVVVVAATPPQCVVAACLERPLLLVVFSSTCPQSGQCSDSAHIWGGGCHGGTGF